MTNLFQVKFQRSFRGCGDEILAPIDYDGDFDINEAITLAATIMMEEYDDDNYWEEF